MMNTLMKLGLALAVVVGLSGCAAALVGATAVGIYSATDTRTVGTQIDDQTVEVRVIAALQSEERFENSRIKVVSYNRRVLLMGQTPNEALKRLAQQIARDTKGVDQVHNEIRVTDVIGMATISKDTWITGKIKTKLLADDEVSGAKIKVVTENGEVFLMGLVEKAQAERAIELARNTNDVKRVIDAFEVI